MDSAASAAWATWVYAMATVAIAIVTGGGLLTWRRQLLWRTEYDLARRILIGFYTVRDRFAEVRHPFMSGGEYSGRPGRDAMNPSRADDLAYAYQGRWSPLQDAALKLKVDLLEAEALWGQELATFERRMRDLNIELFHAVQRYVETIATGQTEVPREELRKMHDTIYGGGTNDAMNKELAELVRGAEAILRPRLGVRSQSTLHRMASRFWKYGARGIETMNADAAAGEHV